MSEVLAGRCEWEILEGDVRDVLRRLPDRSVQCVVTSPPYWGLRSYGTEPQVWGGEPACEHEWVSLSERRNHYKHGSKGRWQHGLLQSENPANWRSDLERGAVCERCGAWLGELGLEPDPFLYVEHVVEVFREVRRVLRDDGVCWLNIADSYCTFSGKVGRAPGGGSQGYRWIERGPATAPNRMPIAGLKEGDLAGVPQRLALALQADGWYWRSDVVWSKPNAIPESVQSRPTKAHEYLYLLTKQPRYFYDNVAIMEPCESGPSDLKKMAEQLPRIGGKHKVADGPLFAASKHTALGRQRAVGNGILRNRRSVWTIPTEPYAGAHFAAYPTLLAELCILAGTSAFGACASCGTPYHRLTRRVKLSHPGPPGGWQREQGIDTIETVGWDSPARRKGNERPRDRMRPPPETSEPGAFVDVETVGWTSGRKRKSGEKRGSGPRSRRQTREKGSPSVPDDYAGASIETTGSEPACGCGSSGVVPCIVLDPFSGSGRTGVVARRLGRRFIGIDLSAEYAELGRTEISEACPSDFPLFRPEASEARSVTVQEGLFE